MYVIHAKVRRDPHTTTPVTVRAHEVAILQSLFGQENVHTHDGKVLDVKNLRPEDVAGKHPMPEDEYERLSAKYGGDEKGSYVEQVYGKKAGGGLDTAIEKLHAVVSKLTKADEAASAESGEGRPRGRRGASAGGEGAAGAESGAQE
ncbi:hypothetical protein [Herbaspirillum chlorophenolicum]|uniref:hypothetical protein n=1 Tax=Herbaspirillum chlorophenolicum TaxID=211589 RepID=UPI000B2BDA6A|nr:hypothetical protein [Herbaspirillum chlorophenolicum]